MNRFLLLSFLLMAANTACPMTERNHCWTQRIKNSLSNLYAKALSYCSFNKKPLARNEAVSETLSSSTQQDRLQKRHEQIRMAAWSGTLKTVPAKNNTHEDNIQNPIIIAKKIPFIKQPAYLMECNDPGFSRNLEKFYAKEYARMLKAEDGIITNHTPTVEIPVKHAGLTITQRSEEIYREHKLARYSYDKTEPIDTIVINGACAQVNQMIIRQHEEHLSKPCVYVTVKHNERDPLDKAHVTFNTHGTILFVKIDNADRYDLELHLPRRMKTPEIKYTKPQREPLQIIKQ